MSTKSLRIIHDHWQSCASKHAKSQFDWKQIHAFVEHANCFTQGVTPWRCIISKSILLYNIGYFIQQRVGHISVKDDHLAYRRQNKSAIIPTSLTHQHTHTDTHPNTHTNTHTRAILNKDIVPHHDLTSAKLGYRKTERPVGWKRQPAMTFPDL